MSNQSKCEMARLRYCQKSYFGYCNADDTDVERCPYLKAIEEITRRGSVKSNLRTALLMGANAIKVLQNLKEDKEDN